MIKKYSVILLHCIMLASLVLGSSLYASEPQKKPQKTTAKPSATPKLSVNRYNTIARDLYKVETPTTKAAEEFKKLIEDQEILNQKPLCKQELDLALEDFASRARVVEQKVRDNLKKILIERSIMKRRNQTLPPLGEALAAQLEEYQKRYQQAKPTPTTPPAQKPPVKEQPKPTPIKPIQPRPQPQVLEPSSETKQKPSDVQEKVKPSVAEQPEQEEEEIEIETEEEVPVRPEAPQKKTPALQANQLVPFVEPTLANQAISIQQQFLTLAKNRDLKPIVANTAQVIMNVLKGSSLTEQPKILATVANNLATVSASPQDRQLVVANATKQTAALTSTNITVKGLVDSSRIAGIPTIKNDTLSLATMRETLQAVISKSNLSDKSKWLVEKLESVFTSGTQQVTQTAPEISTALIVAVAQPDSELQKQLTLMSLTLASCHDTILDTTAQREKMLLDELKATTTASTAAKTGWALAGMLGVGTAYRTPVEIIRDLIVLLSMLQKLGGAVAYLTQKTSDYYEDAVDPTLIPTKEAQSLALTRYIEEYRQDTDYMAEVQTAALTSYENVKTLIEELPDDQTKQQLVLYFNEMVVEPEQYMTPAEKNEQNQSIENSKTLPAPEEELKIVPTKPTQSVSQESQRTKLPGLAPVTLPVRRPLQQPQGKPTEQLEEEGPLVEEVTEEEPTPTPPQKTAHPVTDQSALQKFERLQKRIRNLDISITNAEVLSSIQNELGDLQDAIIRAGKEKGLREALELLDTKFTQVDLIAELNNKLALLNKASGNKQALGFDAITTIRDDFRRAKNKLGNAYSPFEQKLNRSLNTYAQALIQSMNEIKTVHADIAQDLQEAFLLDEMLAKVNAAVHTLRALKENITSSHKAELTSIFVGLCALYDAVLYALYTPDVFNPAITYLKESFTEDIPTLKHYQSLINEFATYFKNNDFADALLNLSLLLDKPEFDQGALHITTLDSNLKNTDGIYKYALPAGKMVKIDTDTEIPTMEAITDSHKKEYVTILEQWKNRVANDGVIRNLQTITPESIKTEAEVEQLEKQLESLEGLIPSSLYNDLAARFEGEEFKTALGTIHVNTKITDLITLIQQALEAFSSSKNVTLIPFQEQYGEILDIITQHLPDKEQELTKQILEAYNNYLTAIAASYRDTLSTMPANGYAGTTDLAKKFKIINNFTEMLTELRELQLLPQDSSASSSFETVYTTLMQGYGYVLATIDAIQAKLIDEAEKKEAGWFTDPSSAQYKTIQKLLAILTSTITMRTDYDKELITPYFSATPLVTAYNQGNLELIAPTLGLVNLTEKDGRYKYARTDVKGYDAQAYATLILPTGKHKIAYEHIIPGWNKFIENAPKLKTAATAALVTTVKGQLDSILEMPVYNEPLKDAHEKDNFIKGLTDVKIPAQTKPLIQQLDSITTALDNKKLLDDLQTLKQDAQKSDWSIIQNKVDNICGNVFAMLDGLIYAIYENALQEGSAAAQKAMVGTIAFMLQEPLKLLVNTVVKHYMPYRSTDFRSLKAYAKKEIPVSERLIGQSDKTEYAYKIGTSTGSPVVYNKIQLLQTGGIDPQAQLKTLNTLVQALAPAAIQITRDVDAINNKLLELANMPPAEQATLDLTEFKDKTIERFNTIQIKYSKLKNDAYKLVAYDALNDLAIALIKTYEGIQ